MPRKRTKPFKPFGKYEDLPQRVCSVAAVALIAFVGTYFLRSSSAATTDNPIGIADYCQLENGKTVIYGWAHDANAAAGPLPNTTVTIGNGGGSVTVASGNNYRETQVDGYLKNKGIPQSNIYGFTATFNGLYKGNSYSISGTVINVGVGANTALLINTGTTNFDGVTRNIFAGNKLPDACLATKPTPTPTPSPTPAPTTTTTTPAPSTTQTTPKPSTSTKTPAASTPSLSSASDATLSAGTTSATLTIPAGNANKAKIMYSANEATLNQTSDTATVADGTANITLGNLSPLTTYFYKIVRLSSDEKTSAASDVQSFKTHGYTALITLTAKDAQLAKNVLLTIPSLGKSATTNENGAATFEDLPAGTHEVEFTFNGATRKETLEINSGTAAEPGKVAAATITLDLERTASVQPLKQPAQKSTPIIPLAIGSGILLAVILGLIVRYRRNHHTYNKASRLPTNLTPSFPIQPQTSPVAAPIYPAQPTMPLPQVAQQAPVTPPAVSPAPLPTSPSPQTSVPHVGESLKDMVLRAMAEEAKRKKMQNKE